MDCLFKTCVFTLGKYEQASHVGLSEHRVITLKSHGVLSFHITLIGWMLIKY